MNFVNEFKSYLDKKSNTECTAISGVKSYVYIYLPQSSNDYSITYSI